MGIAGNRRIGEGGVAAELGNAEVDVASELGALEVARLPNVASENDTGPTTRVGAHRPHA